MRLLHTADWHLGRVFYGVSLIDDQRQILDQIFAVVQRTQPDAFIIAGDLYDRAVPPPEAVALLDDFLSRLVLQARVPVFAIAGNHDSPDRTEFLGRLLSEGNLHLQGRLRAQSAEPVILMDEHGPVAIHLIPFAEPSHVDELLAQEANASDASEDQPATVGKLRRHHGDALRALVERAHAHSPPQMRSVVVAHGSVVGAAESESERVLHGGASAFVEATTFGAFNYAALGHFHRPQDVGGNRVRYAGSPLAYSFSEEGHQKSITQVDIDEAGTVTTEEIELNPLRCLKTVEGRFEDLMCQPRTDDFVRVVLTDTTPILDAGGRLRTRFENLVSVTHTRLQEVVPHVLPRAHRALDDRALLQAFLEETMATPPSETEQAAIEAALASTTTDGQSGPA